MNIIVPIHVEALRVSPSTTQTSSNALYDFSVLGEHPLSNQGGLVASLNFEKQFTKLDAGIHLHWSTPKAYTKGAQDNTNGNLNFPTLPNRWLITRFYREQGASEASTKMWILESDAYGNVNNSGSDAKPIIIPVMESDQDIFGLGNTEMGNLVSLDCATKPCWPETSPPSDRYYLSEDLQATFAYGETFTAYYQNSGGALGFYDSLNDLGINLEASEFSVSYSVIGWIDDVNHDVIRKALSKYNKKKDKNFKAFVKSTFNEDLKMSLEDYSGITTDNYTEVAGLLSGIVAGIGWSIPSGSNTTYPTTKPDPSGIEVAIGNNTAEAISAYVNGVGPNDGPEPKSVDTNLEWLLNAFQYGQLQNLASDYKGVGQLDELLHSKSYRTQTGGYLWAVQSIGNPGGNASPSKNSEITLPLPLAKLLSQLNQQQQLHDQTLDIIEGRRVKLFLDWSYHVDQLSDHVFGGNGSISKLDEDKTGAYLLDGICQHFGLNLQAGSLSLPSSPLEYPTSYQPKAFNIEAPQAQIPSLAEDHTFNSKVNSEAGNAVKQLLTYQFAMEAEIPNGLQKMVDLLSETFSNLAGFKEGASNSSEYINQALISITYVQQIAGVLSSKFDQPGNASLSFTKLINLTTDAVDQFNNLYNAADKSGTLEKWFPITDRGLKKKPYKGGIDLAGYNNLQSWPQKASYPGTKAIIEDLAIQRIIDVEESALNVALAYLWSHSGEQYNSTPASYYIELAEKVITDAVSLAQDVSATLDEANTTYSSLSSTVGATLKSLASTDSDSPLQKLIDELSSPKPKVKKVRKQIKTILGNRKTSTSLKGLLATSAKADWRTMTQKIADSWQAISSTLPYAHASHIIGNFVYVKASSAEYQEVVPGFFAELLSVASSDKEFESWFPKAMAASKAVRDAYGAFDGTKKQKAFFTETLSISEVSDYLSVFQQVTAASPILKKLEKSYTTNTYELRQAPAATYQGPNEPVIALGQGSAGDQIIKPINRNGRASILPCRTELEVVADSEMKGVPKDIKTLGQAIEPPQKGLVKDLKSLLKEAWLLTPEYFKTSINSQNLLDASQYIYNKQEPKIDNIQLQPATGQPGHDLPYSGLLPYFIAYNFWNPTSGSLASNPVYTDVFLPLFIYWKAEYVYSQVYDTQTETYEANYLTNQFEIDEYSVDFQPSSLDNFKKDDTKQNYNTIRGVITLSSATTANLEYQIRTFCKQTLGGYDPQGGPPEKSASDYDEKYNLYLSYVAFKNWDILSQGLSGFNADSLQRIQELQIPLNIPPSWKSKAPGGADDFWITQFLHKQSSKWPSSWADNGLNFDALSSGEDKVFFTPFRAGFLKIDQITLVDAFGRGIDLPSPNPTYVSENMKTTSGNYPDASHKVYLSPKLTQPSRLSFRWLSAASPDGIASFTELNPSPTASPICGWMMANHLDDNLMIYDSTGGPLGALGRQESATKSSIVHWYPVPGQETPTLSEVENSVLKDFISDFVNPGSEFAVFQEFLDVVDQSQQFIISKGLKESSDLAVLLGRPLVLARASLQLELQGLADTSLDDNTNNPTFIPWNGHNAAFQQNEDGFISYDFENFNDASLTGIKIPVLLGDPQISKAGSDPIPYFDDGLVGFFIDGYDTFYTPLKLSGTYSKIKSTYGMGISDLPVSVHPNQKPVTVTLVMDPRVPVRATSGVLPVASVAIPPDQFNQAINKLMAYFLTAPFLTLSNPTGNKFSIPVPDEKGFDWFWYQVGEEDIKASVPQQNMDASFPLKGTQHLVDGWLKLKK